MERRVVIVRGIVQGVGFRPFVYGLAVRWGLHGLVKNQSGAVRIEIEGASSALDGFLEALTQHPPPLAQVNEISWHAAAPVGEMSFRIAASEADASAVFISPDIAACDACLAELLNPADRRFRYPFLNCTNCGPRLTIITGAPYDRSQTTMASFVMCAACRSEYDDPANRRFHAQPTACPDCGPRLAAVDGQGTPLRGRDPLACLLAALRAGKIGALKGLGGYHLVCDARNAAAVAELRRRKHRDEKPLAVMVRDVEAASRLCAMDTSERELLASPRRPIVLLAKRRGLDLADEVAPGNPYLGVMLPYTPLHHLLLQDLGDVPLVMTSGNRTDEPIAYQNDEALERLRGIADVFLIHNRPIHVRCDDSVTRIVDGAELPVRRSRGYAPEPIALPRVCREPILAVGGQLKATFAMGRERQAFVSHHLGDLDHFQARRAFERDIALYEVLFAVRPALLVHDLHPDYASTEYALQRAAREGCRLLPVQHHHAHLASCLAEHGLDEPAIGVVWDGAGYGTDGAIWGGEFLVGDYRRFRRAAHFRYVGMPGGEQATREPWRMAAAHLLDAACDWGPLAERVAPRHLRLIQTMLARRLNSPLTSSVGRLFDAVASLAGVRDRASYEGQAAIELEWRASDVADDSAYPFEIQPTASDAAEPDFLIDTRPLVQAVAADAARRVATPLIARRFHSTMVEVIAAVCGRVRAATGIETVALSGGVFMNALLTKTTVARLRREQFRVYRHRRVPPGDGGLSLGQLAIAAAHAERGAAD